MSTLDNILRSLVIQSGGMASRPLPTGAAPEGTVEYVAKSQIKELLLKEVSELIVSEDHIYPEDIRLVIEEEL